MAMALQRVESLSARMGRAEIDTPPCTKCKYCAIELGRLGIDNPSLLCYNGGEGEVAVVGDPIGRDEYDKGFCRGFVYRSTRIDNDVWENYIGSV